MAKKLVFFGRNSHNGGNEWGNEKIFKLIVVKKIVLLGSTLLLKEISRDLEGITVPSSMDLESMGRYIHF